MRFLVTGAAGFVGSHLSRRLVDDGHVVFGVDCLRANYDVAEKKANLAWVATAGSVDQRDLDLREDPLDEVVAGVDAAQRGTPFPRFGDGSQIRDVTFVGDVVDATVAAAAASLEPGAVLNVAGGSQVSLAELIERVEGLTGTTIAIDQREVQAGDVTRTGGDTTRIGEQLGWAPATGLDDGLDAMAAWAAA